MDLPLNSLKARLSADDPTPHIGLFSSLADNYAGEMVAAAGFDWVVYDAEHAPNDIRSLLGQAQAASGYDIDVAVRPWTHDKELFKRILDVGFQTLMVPMVDTPAQAEAIVSWTRYPPAGGRGVASGRAARWGLVDNYFARANDQICVVAQIETVEGYNNIEAIAGVSGIDALFIGPSDLGASMGHLGNAGHPDVKAAVLDAIARVRAAGKPVGVYASNEDAAREFAAAGATLMLVGVDAYVLSKGLAALAARFGPN